MLLLELKKCNLTRLIIQTIFRSNKSDVNKKKLVMNYEIKRICFSYLFKKEIILIVCNIYCILICLRINLNYGSWRWTDQFQVHRICETKKLLDVRLFSLADLFAIFYYLIFSLLNIIRLLTLTVLCFNGWNISKSNLSKPRTD